MNVLLLIAPMSFGPITGLGPWVGFSDTGLISSLFIVAITLVSGPFLLLSKKFRQRGVLFLVVALSMIVLIMPAISASQELRSFGFYMTAKRAEPLVAAMKKFQEDTGHTPASFDELVPAYIAKIPYGLPPLKIGNEPNGNDWSLSADVSIGVLNWDIFVYNSDQNYPENSGYERLGDWAYYHE
ncbi:MAG TPA: hypothetical protein DEA55_02910 [Rhodospirillaceae bacterium]|nr:hypothetical protein [Rhodospirillaceae bacterium]